MLDVRFRMAKIEVCEVVERYYVHLLIVRLKCEY
jgi:hypothetical protein